AAPWFVLVSLQNPEFAQFFFIHEHFTRFLTGEHRRTQAWWYFVPILALGFLPWMFALPAAVAHAWRTERARSTFRPLTFALAWSGFVVVFFSASGSKLPAYILPAFPPLALVLGRYLVDAPAKRLALWALSMAFVALVLAWIAWTAPEDASDDWSRAMYVAAEGWTFLGAGLLFALGLAAAALLWLGRRWLALLALALSVVLAIECLVQAFEKFSPRQSGYEVAQKMLPLLNPGTRLYSVQHYEQTVPFYVGRTMTIVDFVDEFETGFASEPQRWIARLEDFPAAWLRPGEALAIMQPDTYQKLRGQGLPMQLLHEDPRRVLVRKP
ncbi:MAG TPA: phospholipid carrier-dependent glycosyltransferase, partial [Usitatibacter sp.]|nr:phospholipid carrier-dependent glycosyltransferase [Usitatibacter sp.]